MDNRRYFNTCLCCGVLNHVDEMQDRLCDVCINEAVNEDDWIENQLIERFIKLQESPYFIEKDEDDLERPAPKDLSYLELPDFLKTNRLPLSDSEIKKLGQQVALENTQSTEPESNDVYGILFGFISWPSPHRPIAHWKQVVSIDPPLKSSDTDQIQAEMQKIFFNRRFFQTCHYCGQLNHRDHMSGRTCESCMHTVHGVVY